MGIWGGSATPATVQDTLSADTSFTPTEGSTLPNPSVTQSPEALPAFNPFTSDIWSPSASSASSGWNLPGGQSTNPASEQHN